MNASIDGARARLLACLGSFERARALTQSARETVKSAGSIVSAAGMSMYEAWIEQRAGDLVAWEQALRAGLDELQSSDERAFTATILGYLAQSLYEQGRLDEAYDLCAQVRDLSPPEDAVNFVYADAIEGAVLVRRGDHEQGRPLLLAALARVDASDFFFCRAEIRQLLADALVLAGESEAARSYALEALDIYAAKGDVAGAAHARRRFVEIGLDVT